MSVQIPTCPPGHDLLAGKTAVITAAAGTGIGFSAALRCSEEGATIMISDIHEKRLAEAADRIEKETGKRPATHMCNVTSEEEVQALPPVALCHPLDPGSLSRISRLRILAAHPSSPSSPPGPSLGRSRQRRPALDIESRTRLISRTMSLGGASNPLVAIALGKLLIIGVLLTVNRRRGRRTAAPAD
jgi:hypothetical protein